MVFLRWLLAYDLRNDLRDISAGTGVISDTAKTSFSTETGKGVYLGCFSNEAS
jgi:hypothetical protein